MSGGVDECFGDGSRSVSGPGAVEGFSRGVDFHDKGEIVREGGRVGKRLSGGQLVGQQAELIADPGLEVDGVLMGRRVGVWYLG